MSYEAPDWRSLATTLPRRLAVHLPSVLGIPDEGWQHDASSIVERRHFLDSSVWPLLGARDAAFPGRPLVRSPVYGSAGHSLVTVRLRPVPCSSLATFAPSSPIVFSPLPVWPSTDSLFFFLETTLK